MPTKADLWLRHKGQGRARRVDSWYFRHARLFTKDESVARERKRQVVGGKWRPPVEQRAAGAMAEAFRPAPPPPDAPPPPPVPLQLAAAEAAGAAPSEDWAGAAAAAAAEGFTSEVDDQGAAEPDASTAAPPPPQISNDELAKLVVALQIKGITLYTRKRVFKGFVAPGLNPELVDDLTTGYKTMFDYAGTAIQLPPWVNGLVVPFVSIASTTGEIVAAFRELAEKQKAAAEKAEAT